MRTRLSALIALLIGVLALGFSFLHTQFSSLPEITDRFVPDLDRISQLNKGCTVARFTANENANITLFEFFQPSLVPCASPQSKNATVVIVHGWGEHSGRYDRFSHQLAQNGYHVYRYDQRSNGYSSGRVGYAELEEIYADMEQVLLERVVMYVKPLLCDANKEHSLFLFGHSLGGFSVVTYDMLNQGYQRLQTNMAQPFVISGIITSNAALAIGKDISDSILFPVSRVLAPIIGKFLPSLPVQAPLSPEFLTRNKSSVAEYASDPRIYKGPFLAGLSAQLLNSYMKIDRDNLYSNVREPLLVLYGTADKSVCPDGSKQLYERSSSTDKEIIEYPGFYHELLQEPESDNVVQDILHWLNRHTGGTL